MRIGGAILRRGFIGAVVALVVLGPRLPEYANIGNGGTWAPTGSMTNARFGGTATLLQNCQVLAAGGIGSGGFSLRAAELFDPSLGQWTPVNNMTIDRSDFTATLLTNGQVLVVGGLNAPFALASAELFDPATGTWSPTGSLSVARQDHSATLLANGLVLIAGGDDSNGDSLASAELYNPATGTFTPTGSLATPRGGHSATLLPDGKVLVAGGESFGGALASAELYDPATGTWTATGPMTVARLEQATTLLNTGQVLVAGGFNQQTFSYLSSAEVYNPAAGTWTATGAMTVARAAHTLTLLGSGHVLAAGGNSTVGFVASTELYDPTTGTWTASGSMTTARDNHTATLLQNGQVLVAGGLSGTFVALNGAELYTPGAPAQLAASLTTARVGQALGLTGSRFAAIEPVALSLDSTPLTTTTSGVTGTVVATITVPPATYGPHTLNALGGASGLAASTTLSVTASLGLASYVGGTGASDSASGSGFGASERVVLHWNTLSGPTLGTTTSGTQGSFGGASALHFTIPSGTKGWHRLYAIGMRTAAQASSVLFHR